MHVDRPEPRRGDHVPRQDLPVGRDDQQVRVERPQLRQPLGGVDALGVCRWHTRFAGDLRHALAGLARGAPLAAGVALRLRHQPDDVLLRREQRLERRLGEGAGAHHHDSHGSPGERPASAGW
jgi:hypothetical protein